MNRHEFKNLATDVVNRSANSVLPHLVFEADDRAFIPGGNNGPHGHLETPVRNTSHALVLFSHLWKTTGEKKWRDASMCLVAWLCSEDNRFYRQNAFVARQIEGADRVNGVIGPAWVVEGLLHAHSAYGSDGTLSRAKKIIESMPISRNNGLWHRNDPFTKKYSVDRTYDHQLAFAVQVARLGDVDSLKLFLDRSHEITLDTRQDGMFRHLAVSSDLKGLLLRLSEKYRTIKSPKWLYQVERGYHHYNLFLLAQLVNTGIDHPLYHSTRFNSAIDFFCRLRPGTGGDRYGAEYNHPAFASAYICDVFRLWNRIEWDFSEFADHIQTVFPAHAQNWYSRFDPLTQMVRSYEGVYFLENLQCVD